MSTFATPNDPAFVEDDDARACLSALAAYLGCASDEITTACRALDLASDAVIVVDRRQRILYANRRAGDLTGRPLSELLGRRCADGMRFVTCGASCSLFDEGVVCDRTCALIERSGKPRDVVKNARILRDARGEPVGGIETIHDVTDLRAPPIDDGLGPERRLVSTTAVAAGGGALALGLDGCIAGASAQAAVLLGLESTDASGRTLASLVEGEVDDLMRAVLTAGAPAPAPIDVRARAFPDRRLTLAVTPVLGPQGIPTGATAVLRVEPDGSPQSFFGLIGRSRACRRLAGAIAALAEGDATVLVTGESGVGKERVARALHDAGPRRDQPYVAVNCATLTEPLLESELFGHEKGAFTGATSSKPGRLELCGRGTFLFDEVGCLPLALQAKLLRVLEQREFERVGGTRTLRLEARIVAATNSDLLGAVRAGSFRQDLYYRLCVVPLVVPPLRERPDDIVPLAQHFLAELTPPARGRVALSLAASKALERHGWPGNVRELRSALQYALAVGRGPVIDVADLPPALGHLAARDGDERGRILAALEQAHYAREHAAELLGMSRTSLWRKMRKLGIATERQ